MEYKVRPLGKTCAATGEPLVPGRRVYSALVEQNGDLQRLDFSSQSWEGPPPGTVGYWQCIVPAPEIRHTSALDTEMLLDYFEQLHDEGNENQEKVLYVLALFLLQRRRLKLDSSRSEDSAEWLELVGSRGEGPYEIRDLQLSQEEIGELQHALSVQLSTDWNAA